MRKLLILTLLILTLSAPSFAGETADLTMKAGADYRATLTWSDPKTGAPIDITGNSYAAQFRSALGPGGALFANYSVVVTNAAAGLMQLRLSHGQTLPLTNKTGVWDLRQVDPTGLVSYEFGGKVVVLPTGTKP